MNNASIKRLDWDSNFFEIEVGSYWVQDSDTNFELPGEFDLVYLFSNQPLNDNSVSHCMDQKVVFTKNTANETIIEPRVERYEGEINQELIDLSIQSGIYSRFKLDERLSPFFKKLYTLWIKNSIESDLADDVFVYKSGHRIIGLLTLKEKTDYYEIGLVSVSESHRGKGIGTALLQKVDAVVRGHKEVKVATQLNNEAACNLYRKSGYFQSSITYIYHLWQ